MKQDKNGIVQKKIFFVGDFAAFRCFTPRQRVNKETQGIAMKYYGLILYLPIVKLQDKNPLVRKGIGEMTMSMGKWNSKSEAEREYKKRLAELPYTKKLLDFGQRSCIYHQVFDVDRGCLLIEANTLRKLYSLFETIKLSAGLIHLNFSDDINLIRLRRRPPKENCSKEDLSHLVVPSEDIHEARFELDIICGQIIKDKDIENLDKITQSIMRMPSIRKALACYWVSQNIFYTHLVGSYIHSHSLPDLKHMPTHKYKAYNLLLKEKMAMSFIAAYRGIEAIFNCRFSEKNFRKGTNTYKQMIEGKIKGLHWNSRYRRVFYQKRYKRSPKTSNVATMIKHFLIVRNRRAGHGLEWPHKTVQARLTIDMVSEIQAFLHYLMHFALFK